MNSSIPSNQTCFGLSQMRKISGLRGWLLEDPTSGYKTLHYATQAEESSVGCEKISVTTSSLTSNCLTPNCNPLDYLWGMVVQETNKIHTTPKMKS